MCIDFEILKDQADTCHPIILPSKDASIHTGYEQLQRIRTGCVVDLEVSFASKPGRHPPPSDTALFGRRLIPSTILIHS
jgi:hypothetical protein